MTYRRTDSKYRSRQHYREELASERAVMGKRVKRQPTQDEVECKLATLLYFRDNAAARRGERAYPRMGDYVASIVPDYGPRRSVATEFAKSRFAELEAA